MIDVPSGRFWTATSTTRRCSSSVNVDASPVVPQTTKPSEPCSARWCRRSTKAPSSTFRSSSNGVTIAVRMAPSPATDDILPGSARERVAAGHLGRGLVRAVGVGDAAGGLRGLLPRGLLDGLRGGGRRGRVGRRLAGGARRGRRRLGLGARLLALVELGLDLVELGLRLVGQVLGALLERAVLGLLLRLLG